MKTIAAALLLLIAALAPAQRPGQGPALTGVFLLSNPAVQTELKLTASQKKNLETQLKSAMQSSMVAPPKPGERPDPAKMRKQWEAAQKKREAAEKKVLAILNASQKKRLKEITYQMIGLNIVLHPEVDGQLKLNEAQKKKIMDIQRAQGQAMQKLFQPSGSPPKPGASREEMQKYSKQQSERMRANQGKIQKLRKDTDAKILAVLTAQQRQKWQALTGKPFKMPGMMG